MSWKLALGKRQTFSMSFLHQSVLTPLNTQNFLHSVSNTPTVELSFLQFHDQDILKVIRALHVNKAHGCDDISIRIMKICDQSLLKPLSIVYQNCLNTGTFPLTSGKITHMWRRWSIPQNFLLAFIVELWKTRKSELWKTEKKLLEISSFYTYVPKTTIVWGTLLSFLKFLLSFLLQFISFSCHICISEWVHSIVAWMSRTFLLDAGMKSD